MRIGVDLACWANPRGYGRFTRGLITALVSEPSSHEFILFIDAQTRADPQWPLPAGAHYVVVPTKTAPSLAASASGRRSLRDLRAMALAVAHTSLDILFYPTVYSYFPALTQARVVLGVHDVIAEDYPDLVFPDRRARWLWRLKGHLAHRRADRIVAVSDYARAGILRRFSHRPDEVWVVGEAPDAAFQPVRDASRIAASLARQGLNPSARFVACLGGLNPHKNLARLLEVVADLRRETAFSDLQVVFIGPAESDSFTPGAGDVRRAAEQFDLNGAAHFTGYLPDEEVACWLSAAQVLALPSFDEGFGLAAVEAAACGTAVMATRNSPLPRLLEGGGLFIEPTQTQEIRAALTTLLGDDGTRQQMGQVALERASRLTWQRAARQFLDLVASLPPKALPRANRR